MMGYHFSWCALCFSNPGAFCCGSFCFFAYFHPWARNCSRYSSLAPCDDFLKVFAPHSTACIIITVFSIVVLRVAESSIQRQLNWYGATEHRICSAKYLPLATLHGKKKNNPCNVQTWLTELAVRNLIHCIYKCIVTYFLKISFT